MTAHLEVRDLHAWYGESHVLHGIGFEVAEGECVALLGRNGAGRTTTLRAVMGLVGRRAGSVRIAGRETIALPTHRIARQGVGYCPEERAIYASLSCEENLLLPPRLGDSPGMSVAQIYRLFPNLQERAASQGTRLSGGEQQMLALARVLRTGARLLLLDEISEGLAPVIVERLAEVVASLKQQGYTVLLVEQNFEFAAAFADRLLVVEHGRIVHQVAQGEIDAGLGRIEQLLGI